MSSWDDFLTMIKGKHQHPEPQASRSGSPKAETLAPLMEGPEIETFESASSKKEGKSALQHWMKGQLAKGPSASSYKRSDLHLLLGVLGTPLAPVTVNNDPLPLMSIKGTPIEASSAQYILQQYIAASGARLQCSTQNSFALGRVKMLTSEYETATKITKTKHPSKAAETGVFVLWQMMPDMWYVELVVGGNKVYAGSNGKLVWRHTPWLGAHAAKGPIRPLRRVLQGLDPRSTASMFADAKCIGEKKVNGEDCFILKLIVDPATLASRSDGPVDIIRHVLFGYFSQRSGLLIHMEDSHLTRIQSAGGDAIYWETTINSFLEDYRPIDGVMIAHSGRTIATLFRFGEVAMSHTKTRMEEEWTIEEVAFNVPGLSMDCFIPPADIRYGSVGENYELPHEDRGKRTVGNRSKVVALEKSRENLDNIIWRVEV